VSIDTSIRSVFSGVTLRTGFDHERFFGAGQSGQEKQHRHGMIFDLRGLINRKSHG
jgi:hypothetical protein